MIDEDVNASTTNTANQEGNSDMSWLHGKIFQLELKQSVIDKLRTIAYLESKKRNTTISVYKVAREAIYKLIDDNAEAIRNCQPQSELPSQPPLATL